MIKSTDLIHPTKKKSLKIGIIRSSSIGDVVLASSCLHLLQLLRIEADIVWIGKEPALSIIKDSFPSIRCFEITKTTAMREVLNVLEGSDFLLDLQTNLRSRIISKSFKKNFRKPYFICPKSYFQRNRLILEGRVYGRKHTLSQRAREVVKHQYRLMSDTLLSALQKNKILDSLTFDSHKTPELFDPYPMLDVSKYQQSPPWLKVLQYGKWVGVACGASYETKRAPLDIFSGVLNTLQTQHYHASSQPLGLLLLGDLKDREVSLKLLEELNWKGPVLNLSGQISLSENAVALKYASCLLSNDSSLGHIAEAVDTPTAILFGPTVEGFGFAPRKKESRAFSAPLGCRPCSKHGKNPCRFGDMLCFKQLPQQEISNFIYGILTTQGQSHVV